MHELIEQLRAYHQAKAQQLLALEQGRNALTDRPEGQNARKALSSLLDPFHGPNEEAHHHNEELILAQLRLTPAPIHRRVAEISADHTAFGKFIVDLVQLVEDGSISTGELCMRIDNFISHYDDHASGEEQIFFPIADEYLTARHWNEIKSSWI